MSRSLAHHRLISQRRRASCGKGLWARRVSDAIQAVEDEVDLSTGNSSTTFASRHDTQQLDGQETPSCHTERSELLSKAVTVSIVQTALYIRE